jgi:hypothetical protein
VPYPLLAAVPYITPVRSSQLRKSRREPARSVLRL